MNIMPGRRTFFLAVVAGCLFAGCSEVDVATEQPESSNEVQLVGSGDPSTAAQTTRTVSESPSSMADSTATRDDEAAAEAPAQTRREPIYIEKANGEDLIAEAVAKARLDNKHVLIEWGGNWCGWCYKLHDVFSHDEVVRPLVYENFELVLIDSRTNTELMQYYGGSERHYSFPHLTVLDSDGNVLVNQNTEPLEDGRAHSSALVAEFLKKWLPTPLNAQTLLNSALQQANAEDKQILMHVGTPYCGWCKVLSRFLADHATTIEQDFIDLKIDTLRMTNGGSVADQFRPDGAQGIPWIVILDAAGDVRATSVGPDGNCGYPVSEPEIDHFLTMLQDTRQRMDDDALQQLRANLRQFRVEREQRRQGEL